MKKAKLKVIIEELKGKNAKDYKENSELESKNFHKDLQICIGILEKYTNVQLDISFEDVGWGQSCQKYNISFERTKL